MNIKFFIAAMCCAVSVSASPIVVVDGMLTDNRVGVDGVFDVVIEVRDDTGTERLSTTEAGVIFVDGAFAFDLDVADIADDLASGAVLTLDASVGDLAATTQLGAVFRARASDEADVASTTREAGFLGTIDQASLINFQPVADVGAFSVAFANLVSLPNGIADGVDNGNVDGVGEGMVISGIRLILRNITTAQIADRTIQNVALRDKGFTFRHFAQLSVDDFADNGLIGEDLGTLAAADIVGNTRQIFSVTASGCDNVGTLSTSAVCTRTACGTGGRITCGFEGCEPSPATNTCPNTPVGRLVFAP